MLRQTTGFSTSTRAVIPKIGNSVRLRADWVGYEDADPPGLHADRLQLYQGLNRGMNSFEVFKDSECGVGSAITGAEATSIEIWAR